MPASAWSLDLTIMLQVNHVPYLRYTKHRFLYVREAEDLARVILQYFGEHIAGRPLIPF